ncbi:Cullin-4B [Laetiporus sulphureus 93-53]|uniref:Cullin-4B n=1 Tax=Laetiporus sulphureus 93-53 TaxID=1314785 RepID=A0A165FJ65_9APHY|nr:Cullin-4B [Laetiporus sulphureus 93-53]KZT09051.1 Cullin-4B [Laetiporus sulphureus 93-53]
MTDVFTILSLPKTSDAFSAAFTSSTHVADPGSASPPRKMARLDVDSDSASTSRSRASSRPQPREGGGPVVIKFIGLAAQPSTSAQGDRDFALVKRSIRVLLSKDSRDVLPATYDQIYRACRSAVCVHGRGEGLYENVRLELERCIGGLANGLLQSRAEAVEWLVAFNDVCAWFERAVGFLESTLTYLDRTYVTSRKELRDIHTLSYDSFAARIFENAGIMERLRAGIKSWLEWERSQPAPHKLRDQILKLIRHLFVHGQYHAVFESFYISLTRSFYAAESAERAEALKGNAQKFLKHCEHRRQEEDQRARDVLPESSRGEIIDVTDKALLSSRLVWLAKDALGPLMEKKNEQNLGKMYHLFAKVDGLNVLCAAFKLHVQNTVRNIVKDVERDEDMVPRLLEFKAFADRLVNDAFADTVSDGQQSTALQASASISARSPKKVPNKDFGYALIDAFQSGFKTRRNKPAEMIAKYLDRAMRKGQKGKKDEEFQAELDAMLGLYRFTDDKDVFRTFYHRALAKRLLLERSASDDFEKAMLKKLQEQYDPEFGMGDKMFSDLMLSRDLMGEYHEQRARFGDESSQNLSVMVLQSSNWPFAARKQDVDLPPNMQDELNEYAAFYKHKHTGRKLDWDHALGTATLRAKFKNGEKELSVSLYQAIVLLLFNESAEIHFRDIKEQVRMEDSELRRTLQSLALGKKRVLKKVPMSKDVKDDDVFQFNADFTDPHYQVHINSIQVKETPEESRRTQTSIEGDRKHALDAAIVRVMKARKELHYEQLKAETIIAVKSHFSPEVSVIKQRIQGLVEQEYLRRDEKDMNLYIYVA